MKTIIWKGIAYNSLEYFSLTKQEGTFIARSRIIGTYEDKMYIVDYHLSMNDEWKVQHFRIAYEVNNIRDEIIGEKNNKEWKINGSMCPDYTGFDFIDISLTPFTNTLPIKNLNLAIGQEQELDVMYVHIPDNYIKPVRQQYRKNIDGTYHYENIPNDFEADISVDESGLVIFYPTLFERVAENKTCNNEF